MSTGPLIIVPKMVPPGGRLAIGEKSYAPKCDRCLRTASERNPVWPTQRESWNPREPFRCDALCYECRLALQGKL